MNRVLGLSMTSTAVRWVLVQGTMGEGASLDRGALDVDATFDADGLLDALLDDMGNVAESRIHAIGVTWSSQAEAAAGTLLQALAGRGLDNVIAVSEVEAADALARGIADIAGYDDVAVCIVEPDAALIATIAAEGVTVDRINRSLVDGVELTPSVLALLDLDGPRDALFVVGSDDLDPIVSSLADRVTAPVISAAEADLALARGAAVASAQAVNDLDAQTAFIRPQWMSKVGVLTSVLVAAVVTFVVSVSVALGLRVTPDSSSEQPQVANAAGEPAHVASAPSVAQSAPEPPPAAAPPSPAAPEALPPVKETAEAAPPAPEVTVADEPVYEPPAAEPVYEPPAAAPPAPVPAYVPPSIPGYVAPPPTPPQPPRLRDRILDRIPIINRFHEPDYRYGR